MPALLPAASPALPFSHVPLLPTKRAQPYVAACMMEEVTLPEEQWELSVDNEPTSGAC